MSVSQWNVKQKQTRDSVIYLICHCLCKYLIDGIDKRHLSLWMKLKNVNLRVMSYLTM